ncbi:MAG: hypothetical protein DMF06_10980 [Verrucomicrobia bacterium]|nr:MAG: hypothetical protein DMF06_10980 [Verrucomicrobiota bacterium]
MEIWKDPRMKRKICLALLALSSGFMMVSAAEVDKCIEKFEACKVTCENLKAQCKARGNDIAYCNSRLNQCNADCNKGVKDCQAKNATTAPAKPAPKK